MARMRRACLASAVRAASARNCEILKSWCVISIADMLPAPRINDMLHRVTVAVVWESPQESGSQAAGIISAVRLLPQPVPVFFRDAVRVVRQKRLDLSGAPAVTFQRSHNLEKSFGTFAGFGAVTHGLHDPIGHVAGAV